MSGFELRTYSAAEKAYMHQECVICFDPLHFREVSFLVDENDDRVCNHYFHSECIQEWADSEDNCPLCRSEFHTIKPVPAVEVDSKAWFKFMDVNNDGSLSYNEIVEGLKAQLPLDWAEIEEHVDQLWNQWDQNRDGSISYEEFSDETRGVLVYLKNTYPKNPRPEPPNLIEDYDRWFDYWDEDHSGTLDKAEITRALIKTFRIYNIDKGHIQNMVTEIWPAFDTDNSGVIEREEFVSADNLGDAIAAQITYELSLRLSAEEEEEQEEEEEENEIYIGEEIESLDEEQLVSTDEGVAEEGK